MPARRWMLAASLFAALCGVLLLLAPGAGIVGIVPVIAWYAVVVGVVLIVGAVRIRS
ncbi:hypothetical protein [Rhodococcus opacus]|uniref:hypothetical protein n=1 Tax=Rhodococcus opacus TaxID=37919 RepID=UPI00294B3149|nr:hypothetical protein [Rhodococcus opacus]